MPCIDCERVKEFVLIQIKRGGDNIVIFYLNYIRAPELNAWAFSGTGVSVRLNKASKVQVCDATEAAQRFYARYIKNYISSVQILKLWII